MAHESSALSTITPAVSGVVAAAQRLQDLAWTMREQDLDPSTTDQIEQLATTILSAASLRNPHDRRAQKLAEILQYLARRIGTMLDAATGGGVQHMAARRPGPQPADFLLDPLSAPVRTSTASPPEAEPAPVTEQPPANDPLAALRAMSEEERIALFT